MFYSGLYINQETGLLSIVIIEKDLKSARKLYRISHINKLYLNNKKEIPLKTLEEIKSSDSFITRKKVFSQNGRPPKITYTQPLFLMAEKSNNSEYINWLRGEQFSVESLIYEENNKWRSEEPLPRRFGMNYYVNPSDMKKTLIKSCKGERLLFNDNVELAGELKEDLEKALAEDVQSDLISALSVSIWFCERVRQIKRY